MTAIFHLHSQKPENQMRSHSTVRAGHVFKNVTFSSIRHSPQEIQRWFIAICHPSMMQHVLCGVDSKVAPSTEMFSRRLWNSRSCVFTGRVPDTSYCGKPQRKAGLVQARLIAVWVMIRFGLRLGKVGWACETSSSPSNHSSWYSNPQAPPFLRIPATHQSRLPISIAVLYRTRHGAFKNLEGIYGWISKMRFFGSLLLDGDRTSR